MPLYEKISAQLYGPRGKEIRYVISGVTSEILEYASFVLLISTTHALIFSNSISFIIGIASGFVLHKLWSFAGSHQFKTHHQVVVYSCLAMFNFFMTNLLIQLFVSTAGFRPLAAKLAVMVISAAWSYLLFNKVIFRHKT